MSPAYVPPHMRGKPAAGSGDSPAGDRLTTNDRFAQRASRTSRHMDPSDGYTLGDIGRQLGLADTESLGTLNGGKIPAIPEKATVRRATHDQTVLGDGVEAEDAGLGQILGSGKDSEQQSDAGKEQVSYILLFKDQHPDWPPDVFCKSNLHLLPGSHTTINSDTDAEIVLQVYEKRTDEKPLVVAVFSQDPPVSLHTSTFDKRRFRSDKFWFSGWYEITRVRYLEPKSQDLILMLDRKFRCPVSSLGTNARGGQRREDLDWGRVRAQGNQAGSDSRAGDEKDGEQEQREKAGLLSSGPGIDGASGTELGTGTRVRSAAHWGKSLSMRWAVISLSPVDRNVGLEKENDVTARRKIMEETMAKTSSNSNPMVLMKTSHVHPSSNENVKNVIKDDDRGDDGVKELLESLKLEQ